MRGCLQKYYLQSLLAIDSLSHTIVATGRLEHGINVAGSTGDTTSAQWYSQQSDERRHRATKSSSGPFLDRRGSSHKTQDPRVGFVTLEWLRRKPIVNRNFETKYFEENKPVFSLFCGLKI